MEIMQYTNRISSAIPSIGQHSKYAVLGKKHNKSLIYQNILDYNQANGSQGYPMNITLNLVPLVAVRVRHRYRCMLEILQSSNHNTNWNHIPYWPYINLFHCSLFTYIVLTCLCTKAYTHIWSRWGPHPKQIVDTSTGWQTASSHHPDNMKSILIVNQNKKQ